MMFKYNKVNKKLADECLGLINHYRGIKENSVFDTFYHRHLDCFESLIEDWKKNAEDLFAVIMCRKGHKHNNGSYSPTYVTVCKEPHWINEGIMLTGGFYDATKFDLDSDDLYSFLKFVNNKFPDKEFEIVVVSKGVFGDNPKEVWSLDEIRGDFDRTGKVAGNLVKEVVE